MLYRMHLLYDNWRIPLHHIFILVCLYYFLNKISFDLNPFLASIEKNFIFIFTASNELVFINFYAEWCRFSNLLQPIFDEAADKVYRCHLENCCFAFNC